MDKQDKILPAWGGRARGEKIEPDAVRGYAYVRLIMLPNCIDEARFSTSKFDPLLPANDATV